MIGPKVIEVKVRFLSCSECLCFHRRMLKSGRDTSKLSGADSEMFQEVI